MTQAQQIPTNNDHSLDLSQGVAYLNALVENQARIRRETQRDLGTFLRGIPQDLPKGGPNLPKGGGMPKGGPTLPKHGQDKFCSTDIYNTIKRH